MIFFIARDEVSRSSCVERLKKREKNISVYIFFFFFIYIPPVLLWIIFWSQMIPLSQRKPDTTQMKDNER